MLASSVHPPWRNFSELQNSSFAIGSPPKTLRKTYASLADLTVRVWLTPRFETQTFAPQQIYAPTTESLLRLSDGGRSAGNFQNLMAPSTGWSNFGKSARREIRHLSSDDNRPEQSPDKNSLLLGGFFYLREAKFRPGFHHRSALLEQVASLICLLNLIACLVLKSLFREHSIVSVLSCPVSES